jgi:hypothetical protein
MGWFRGLRCHAIGLPWPLCEKNDENDVALGQSDFCFLEFCLRQISHSLVEVTPAAQDDATWRANSLLLG